MGGGPEVTGPRGKRAADVAPEALASMPKKRKDQGDDAIPSGSERAPTLEPESQVRSAGTESAELIFRGALRRLTLGSLPPDVSWTREFWRALDVRAEPVTTALLERAAMALVAWTKAAEASRAKHGEATSKGSRHVGEAAEVVVAVAALHPRQSEARARLEQTVDELSRQLVLQDSAVDFCVAHGRIGRINDAYDALLGQMESSDGINQESKPSGECEAAGIAGVLGDRLAASAASLQHAKDELKATNRAVTEEEAAMEARERERAEAVAMEFKVGEEQAKAIARIDVWHSSADPVASNKQLALQASREAVERCQLAVTAASEASTFNSVVSALLLIVERQWVRQNEATRERADMFVRTNFPALVDSLHTFLVEGSTLHRKLSAEVACREDKRSRLAALSKLEVPSEDLEARQCRNEQKLKRCQHEREMLRQSLLAEVLAQQEIKSRSSQVLSPEGFRFVSEQYRQLVQHCTASHANEGLVQHMKSECPSEEEEKTEDEGAKLEQSAANSARQTCLLM